MNRLFSYFIMFLSLIGQNCFAINPVHTSKSHKSRAKKSFTKICKLKFALFKKAINKKPVKHGLIGAVCGVAGAGLAISLGIAGLAAARHYVYNKLIPGPGKDSWRGDVTFNTRGTRSDPQYQASHYHPAPVVFYGETDKWGWKNTTTIASTVAGIQSQGCPVKKGLK